MDNVVCFDELERDVVQITMVDREHRNTFSAGLVQGLAEAFARIEKHQSYKAVILTGYENYFACGGTQETLLALQAAHAKFTDSRVYMLPFDCTIPVIAAMQGHAIGGGFILGLSADFVIMGRESVYTANFMKYGFTPGMGATAIVPKKLGFALGQELLITAQSYRGAELEKRGILYPVIPRGEVLQYARNLAREIAEKPRLSLVELKRHLNRGLRDEIEIAVRHELEMHASTFHQVDVEHRIRELFGK